MEVRALDQPPQAIDAMVLDGRPLLLGFKILEVDANERFLDVELARLAVESDAAPIINAVGGIGVLLDLDQHDTRVNRMQATRGNEESVPRQNGEAVNVIFDRFLLPIVVREA